MAIYYGEVLSPVMPVYINNYILFNQLLNVVFDSWNRFLNFEWVRSLLNLSIFARIVA